MLGPQEPAGHMILDEDPRIINFQNSLIVNRTPVVRKMFVLAEQKINGAKKYLTLKYSLMRYFVFFIIFYLY